MNEQKLDIETSKIKNLWVSKHDLGKSNSMDDWYFQSCYEGKAIIMVYKDLEIRDRYDLVLKKVQELWMKMVSCLDRKRDPYDYGFVKVKNYDKK